MHRKEQAMSGEMYLLSCSKTLIAEGPGVQGMLLIHPCDAVPC
jgi:hypothetical protein